MCNLCAAAETTALAEAEAHVMLAEAEEGLSVPYATRPLNKAERRAGVHFGTLDALETVAVDEIRDAIGSLGGTLREQILAAIFQGRDTATPEQVAAGLADMARAQPPAVAAALEGAAAALAGSYSRAAQASSMEAAEEAGRQGRKAPRPVAPSPSKFAIAASIASGILWDRLTEQARKTLLDPAAIANGAPLSRETAGGTLAAIPEDGAVDHARQTLHTVTAEARNETAEAMEPEEIWASEILDGATCQECRAVDQKDYATMAEARKDYPNGPYLRCSGGARCRGTLVFIYGVGQAPPPEAPPWDPGDPGGPAPSAPPRAPNASPATPAPKDAPKPPPAPGAAPPARPKGAPQRYENLEQLPTLAEPRKLSPLEEAALMNPEHDGSGRTKQYNENCSSVATAYEMRRRGYDVTAAALKGGGGRSPREFITGWWKGPDGKPLENTAMPNAQALRETLDLAPDGARGFITIYWKGNGGGHVYNWEKFDGKVHYLEGQVPAAPDAYLHADRARAKGGLYYARTDNATPSNAVAEALEQRTPEYIRERSAGAHLTAAQKRALSVPQVRMRGGNIVFDPPQFKKEGGRWIPMPKDEADAMIELWNKTRVQK